MNRTIFFVLLIGSLMILVMLQGIIATISRIYFGFGTYFYNTIAFASICSSLIGFGIGALVVFNQKTGEQK